MVAAQYPLPMMREDLSLLSGPPLPDGSPTWTIQDPLRNRFFRLGRTEFEILSRWSLGTADKVAADISAETTLTATPTDVEAVQRFLAENCLVAPTQPQISEALKKKATRKREGMLWWILKHYLFIRIPLVHPDRFLDATYPMVRLLTRYLLLSFALAGILGMILVIRQWETFTHTFLYFFSAKGILFYAIAVVCAKLVHELGHAYSAKHFGLRVPTMGVAFLVLLPMFYTDTSETWKLKSRRSRMIIVCAGILSEMALAVTATLLWCFLPDGPMRSACFVIATVTWVASLLLNISPFMRFDGYYLLSDMLNVPNLHERAGALGKWYLRKTLLGMDLPCPERMPPARIRFLILFAYTTWIYRFLLFLGIALIVYHLFFKALGVVLFSVELAWFIGRPILGELRSWGKLRSMIGWGRFIISMAVLLAGTYFLLAFPWQTRITIPALLRSKAVIRIYPPFSAQIEEVHIREGDAVKRGAPLFVLASPELEHDTITAFNEVAFLESQLMRVIGNAELLENSLVIQQQLAGALTRLEGLKNRKKQLIIRTPGDGVIVDMEETLRPGLYIRATQHLASLIDRHQAAIEGFLSEDDLGNIKVGNPGRFYPESGDTAPIDCTITEIDPANTRHLEKPYLASIFGGAIPVSESAEGGMWKTQKTVYRVGLTLNTSKPPPDRVMRGFVSIRGRPKSLFSRAWRRIQAVLIRESGF